MATKRTSRRHVSRNADSGSLALPTSPAFIERIDSVDRHLSTPGQYYTTTGQQAYLVARALTWHPMVEAGEETYFAEGSVFHWTVLTEEKSPASDVLPPELLNEKVQIGQLAEAVPLMSKNAMRQNGDEGGEDWGVTESYFLDKLDAYDRWESAFWRELLQNSRDAGANRIDLSSEETTYSDPATGESLPAVLCICRDNGVGMDKETLKRAFFTLGGSMKPAGAVGGFGDAKELILTPWYRYEVRTRDLLAIGQHQRLFAPGIRSGEPFVQGVEIRVWMPVHKSTNDSYAVGVLEKSHLSGIRVTVNGQRISADLIGGDKVREHPITITTYTVLWSERGEERTQSFAYSDEFYEFTNGLSRKGIAYDTSREQKEVGKMEIWRQPRSKRNGCFVRGSGVFMFEKRVDASIKGAIFVDITAPPRGVFTRKRDALAASSSASGFLNAYLEELAVDPLSALKKQRAERDKERTVYTGSGPLDVRSGEGAAVAEEERARRMAKASRVGADLASRVDLTKSKSKKGGGVELTDQQFDTISKGVKEQLERDQEDADREQESQGGERGPDLVPLPETFDAVAKNVTFVSHEQLAGALQFAAWKPDLFVYQNLDNWKMPKDFNPLTMKPKYLKLIRLWSELCKYALVRLGMFKPFGVGWIFDTERDESGNEMVMGAGYLREADADWLLLNPVKIKRTNPSYEEYPDYLVESDYYNLSDEASIRRLCASVIHEVTHMQGFGKHDQKYAYALTDNIEIAFGMEKAAKKILTGVNRVVREEVKERKAAKEAEAQLPWDVILGKLFFTLRAAYQGDAVEAVAEGKTPVADVVRSVGEVSHILGVGEATYTVGGQFWRRFYGPLPSKPLLRLYESLRDKGLIVNISDDQAREHYNKSVGATFAWPDPREKTEPRRSPSNVGVYNVTERTKEGQKQWVLREGYSGMRGKEVAFGKLWPGDDLADRWRYKDSIRNVRADDLWVVWTPRGSTQHYQMFFSDGILTKLQLGTYADAEVNSWDQGATWGVSTYGTNGVISSRLPQDEPTLTSAAQAQDAVVRQVSEAIGKTTQAARMPRGAWRSSGGEHFFGHDVEGEKRVSLGEVVRGNERRWLAYIWAGGYSDDSQEPTWSEEYDDLEEAKQAVEQQSMKHPLRA